MPKSYRACRLLLFVVACLVLLSIDHAVAAQEGSHAPFKPVLGSGATFYVAPSGSDRNSGLGRENAWQSIQHAADAMRPGDTTVVLAGDYVERVRVTRSGDTGNPITFEAEPGARVVTRGFEIAASHIQIVGFEIANHDQTEPAGFGIYLVGSFNVIAQNYIHDLCMEGIVLSGGGNKNSANTARNTVVNNRVVHAQMAGVHVEGRRNLIEGNDVSRTAQYPEGCRPRHRADADAFRFFGSGHDFRANYAHDIAWGTRENRDPHVDCFQTWGPASDIIIERNLCRWPAAKLTTNNKAVQIESLGGPSRAITIRNNIFVDMRQGINASGASALRTLNNTFDRIVQEAVILHSVPHSQIANNIFYEVGSGRDSYACIDEPSRAGLIVAANDHYMSEGKPGTYCSQAPHLTLNPHFIDPVNLDLRLEPGSPLIGAGIPLAEVSDDFFGQPRPTGSRYDLGAIDSRSESQSLVNGPGLATDK
jgi:Protein of unknown function (DUF1565)